MPFFFSSSFFWLSREKKGFLREHQSKHRCNSFHLCFKFLILYLLSNELCFLSERRLCRVDTDAWAGHLQPSGRFLLWPSPTRPTHGFCTSTSRPQRLQRDLPPDSDGYRTSCSSSSSAVPVRSRSRRNGASNRSLPTAATTADQLDQ